ncbi:protein NEDD1-like isoform X2 [Plectropomus leopardus]|uniref:protein NEDD1-like isoform X2 n=1 Tax=Plectropomus leopardus TaxID=160734 RepID=UPI001C4B7B19|nr:protein NEDD1-like isoform X2 [Plectropomus leopardus]
MSPCPRPQPVHDLRLSPLRRSLLGSVSDSGAVVLWDSNTQKELHVFDGAHKAPGSGLAFSPASELLVVSVGLDKKIVCYDTASRIVLRSIRVDGPLTAVDFTPDGTGLVVGSTQGKIYHYDLRNSGAPTRITAAHKTSVTCLRFQSNANKHKSSKLGSTKIASTKRSSIKVSNSQPDSAPATGPAPHRQVTGTGGAGAEVASREAEGQQGTEQLPVVDKFSSVGRNSLDVFSPAREDCGTHGTTGDTPFGRTHGTTGITSLEMLSREGEGQQVIGRASLDIFSPVREDCHSGATSHRKTPLGTPLVGAAGRCYSPLSAFQTPPPIKEEEPAHAADAEPRDPRKSDKTSSSSVEGEGPTTPTATQQTSHSQPAPPFFTPEPSLRRANGVQAQLSYDSPVQGAPPTMAGTAGRPGARVQGPVTEVPDRFFRVSGRFSNIRAF